MKRILALLLLLPCILFAQPKRYAKLALYEEYYTPQKAAIVWENSWETSMPDTVYNMYIGNVIWFKDTTCYNPEISFRLDSLRGRGDKREARITAVRKSPVKADWIWLYTPSIYEMKMNPQKYPVTVTPTGGYLRKWQDTLMAVTPDSTYRESQWFSYTRKDYWNQIVGADGQGMATWMFQSFIPKDTTQNRRTLKCWMEKVIGDPTVNNGWNQLIRFRMVYYAEQPKQFYDASNNAF
jgi:hypothetical protein